MARESRQELPMPASETPASAKVTYTPAPGDNSMETTWMGHKFMAHVPRDLKIPDPDVMEAFAKPEADRSRAENERIAALPKNLKTNAHLVTLARNNRFFHVGEFDPTQHGYKENITEPKTAEQYRAWAVRWMKKLDSVEDACQKWALEARMRAKLEVGFDDYKYISDFFQPILSELIKREDDPRAVRDKIMKNGEFADLFLQVTRVGEVVG